MSAPCPTRSHSIKCVFSGSTQESASFVPRDRFFSVRMEESPQIITLNHILIAADFPAQLRIFTLQFCRTELSVDRLIIRNFLFQTVNLSLELCNQFVCRIYRLLQFGFLFSAVTYFFARVEIRSKSSRSTATLDEKGMDVATIFSIDRTSTR